MDKVKLRTGVITGLLATIACLSYIIVVQLLGANPLAQLKYLMYTGIYALFFIGIMKYQRDNVNQYSLGAQEGITLGITVNAVTALLTSASLYLYLQYTSLGEKLMAMHQKDLLTLFETTKEKTIETMGEDVYLQILDSVQNIKPSDLAGDLVFGLMVAGFFHTFLFMLIFKTKSS